MEIAIYTLAGKLLLVYLEEVGPCYPDDDVIYFRGIPCRLSSACSPLELEGEEVSHE